MLAQRVRKGKKMVNKNYLSACKVIFKELLRPGLQTTIGLRVKAQAVRQGIVIQVSVFRNYVVTIWRFSSSMIKTALWTGMLTWA